MASMEESEKWKERKKGKVYSLHQKKEEKKSRAFVFSFLPTTLFIWEAKRWRKEGSWKGKRV
jgi:hypothetical protein